MRIAIVDDLSGERALLREQLARQLARRGAEAELLEFDSGEAFLAAEKERRFTAAFLDIYMEGMTGMEAARALRKTDTDCLLVFTTTSTDHALEGFQVRALHYLVKPFAEGEIDALTAYFHSRLREKQAEEALPRQVESLVSELTDRAKGLTGTERVILRYYAEGYTVKDISGLLFISAGTVKGHNSHIYSKLGVDSYNALKAYLDGLRRCERLEDLLQGGGK